MRNISLRLSYLLSAPFGSGLGSDWARGLRDWVSIVLSRARWLYCCSAHAASASSSLASSSSSSSTCGDGSPLGVPPARPDRSISTASRLAAASPVTYTSRARCRRALSPGSGGGGPTPISKTGVKMDLRMSGPYAAVKAARYATKVAATLGGNLSAMVMPNRTRASHVAWFSLPGSPGHPARKPPHTGCSSAKKAPKKPRRISTGCEPRNSPPKTAKSRCSRLLAGHSEACAAAAAASGSKPSPLLSSAERAAATPVDEASMRQSW
mmetsp:Transcript_13053/g.42327  ORF Transcript_13053/g.42327 Transcript_13053/m.42327 type:complete len:267 (+) Transcript_13053:110-910(+)